MGDDKKKKHEADEAARHTGSIRAEDPELADWIEKQWKNGEGLQFLDIAAVYSKGKVFGNVIDREVLSPSTPMDQENAVILSNRFIGAAVRDCTRVIHKAQTYYVRAHHTGGSAEPLDNFPLYITPRTTALTLRDPNGGSSGAIDDEEEIQGADKLTLVYIGKMIEAGQFDKTHYASVFGDLFRLFQGQVNQQQQWINDLMGQNKSMFTEVMTAMREREAALSSAEDRYAHREMMKLKVDLLKDGVRTGRNILTGLFGRTNGPGNATPQPPPSTPSGNGSSEKREEISSGPKSEEQLLLDNFLHDCEDTGIAIKLFGDWKNNDKNELELVTPGIFTAEQFFILVKVNRGVMPANALDDLDMGSGKPSAITFQQAAAAQEIMSEGTASALVQLINVRKRKREEAAAAMPATPSGPSTPSDDKETENV